MKEERIARMREAGTAEEIRTLLAEEMDLLLNGRSTPAEARAVTREAGKILATYQAALRLGKQIKALEREADARDSQLGPGQQ